MAGTSTSSASKRAVGAAGDKRELILAAALDLFAEHGFAGSAVPLVAEAAGVATGTIYRYFPSKEALVNALYQQWKGEIKRRLLDDARPAGTPREEFHRWWAAMSDFVHDNPVAFAFLELHHHEPYLDETSRQVALEIDGAALEFALRGQAAGLVRALPAPMLVALVFGAFTGVVRGMRAYPELFATDALDLAEEAVWELVRAPGT